MFFQQFCHLRHLILCVSSKKCLDIFPKKVPYWLKLNVNKYLALTLQSAYSVFYKLQISRKSHCHMRQYDDVKFFFCSQSSFKQCDEIIQRPAFGPTLF